MASQSEIVAQMATLRNQLTKALNEIKARIAALVAALAAAEQASPELVQEVQSLAAVVQQLDDIVPE